MAETTISAAPATPMTDYHDGVAIVYPAHFHGADKMSHCTAMWLGRVGEVDTTHDALEHVVQRLRKDFELVGSMVMVSHAFGLYGKDRDTLVLRLHDERLMDLRWRLETDLARTLGLGSASKFPYSPHVTVGKALVHDVWPFLENLRPNVVVSLDKPVLWWGNDRPALGGEL